MQTRKSRWLFALLAMFDIAAHRKVPFDDPAGRSFAAD
jgi:hypothetical protein